MPGFPFFGTQKNATALSRSGPCHLQKEKIKTKIFLFKKNFKWKRPPNSGMQGAEKTNEMRWN